LDENRNAWQEYIKTNGYNWINVNDTSGWSSKAARDYYIYATPTMFLVDKVKKIDHNARRCGGNKKSVIE
jgi:hypothetical protein